MQNVVDLAVEQYKQGKSLRQIAVDLKVDRRRVAMRLKELGLTTRCGRQPLTGRPGTTVHFHGYILVHRPDHPAANVRGYVREHRLVMEQHLGRYLTEKEVVHHKNGVVTDNRLENLELFESNAAHVSETLSHFWPTDLMRRWYCEDGLRYTHIAGLLCRSVKSVMNKYAELGIQLEARDRTGSPIESHHLHEVAQLEPKYLGTAVTYAVAYNAISPQLKVLWRELGLPPYGRELRRVRVQDVPSED